MSQCFSSFLSVLFILFILFFFNSFCPLFTAYLCANFFIVFILFIHVILIIISMLFITFYLYFSEMGDRIALQYGGSEAHKKVDYYLYHSLSSFLTVPSYPIQYYSLSPYTLSCSHASRIYVLLFIILTIFIFLIYNLSLIHLISPITYSLSHISSLLSLISPYLPPISYLLPRCHQGQQDTRPLLLQNKESSSLL